MERKEDKTLKECPNCGSEMQEYECPTEGRILKIPFTSIEVIWRNWKSVDYWCPQCVNDEYERPMRAAYDQGCDDTLEKIHSGWIKF